MSRIFLNSGTLIVNVLLKIKYIFLRDSYVCTRWIFIFDSDQAQINSVLAASALLVQGGQF